MAQALVLSPIGEDNEPSEVATSLSFVFGIVANELIELCIPHNVLFTEDGNKIYIMVREFAKKECNYGWMEYVGVVPVSTEVDYEMKETMIEKHKLALRV